MKGIYTTIDRSKILISLPKKIYEKSAVLAAAHKMSERFTVVINSIDDKTVGIYIQPKSGIEASEEVLKEAASDFCNEALDQQVRLDIERRYWPIRELIVKQAFSPISLTDLSKALNKKDNDRS
jgi:His-Xaa-Ser system protein HxsD